MNEEKLERKKENSEFLFLIRRYLCFPFLSSLPNIFDVMAKMLFAYKYSTLNALASVSLTLVGYSQLAIFLQKLTNILFSLQGFIGTSCLLRSWDKFVYWGSSRRGLNKRLDRSFLLVDQRNYPLLLNGVEGVDYVNISFHGFVYIIEMFNELCTKKTKCLILLVYIVLFQQ